MGNWEYITSTSGVVAPYSKTGFWAHLVPPDVFLGLPNTESGLDPQKPKDLSSEQGIRLED